MSESEELPDLREVKLPPPGTTWSLFGFVRANADLNAKNSDEAKWLSQAGLANGYSKARLSNIYTSLHRLRKEQERAMKPKIVEEEIDDFFRLIKQVYKKSSDLTFLITKERRAYQKRIDDLESVLRTALKRFVDKG